MTDQEIANALHNLGLGRHNYQAVALLPLFEVAWADGRVQAAERRLIVERAAKYGVSDDDAWLNRWMTEPPGPALALAARQVLLALNARAGKGWDPPETLDDLIALCVGVAEVAGGLFGLAFTVERSERAALQEIADTLSLGPRLPPEVVAAWNTARRPPPAPDPLSQVATQLRPRRRRTIAQVEAEQARQLEGDRVERAVEGSLVGDARRFVTPPPPPDPGSLFDEDDDTQPFGDHLTSAPPRRAATILPDAPDEDDPTVPYFDGGDVMGGTYILDDDSEDR